MFKKSKIKIIVGILIIGIGLNISGCTNEYNNFIDKSYSEVALETLEERYGEPFEMSQIGGTFGATRNTKKFICNPISNPNTYCFVEVEKDKSEVHDDYANRIMEERYAVMLEEEAKKIFNEEDINIKLSFNPSDNNYEYLDMDLLDFYKNHVYSEYMIHIFINSDGNINKTIESEKILNFAKKILECGLYKNSGIRVWYCKEETYDKVDEKFYSLDLKNNIYDYYVEKNRTYISNYTGIEDQKIEEKYNSVEKLVGNFK